MARILIVEDDSDISSLLRRGLAAEGYETACEAAPEAALARLAAEPFDAAIVDMMLGSESGADLLHEMRLRGHRLPAIVLSALSRVEDRTEGLDAGANDYVVKPFELSELIARLRVQLRRAEPPQNLRFGPLLYDRTARVVSGHGQRMVLTEREGELLEYLIAHAGQVVTRGAIFDALWAPHGGSAENVVDVYIGYLRRKLAPFAGSGIALRTLRGRGFLLTRGESE
ncbi:response regulator transcription factor [Plastorhodobacter daqingensis]|uniref:Response regulator transcription factor n=1 Tax=Plastorhodobacter daqingensis TaxID=1387281 RepID=A0ABW2UKK4_9RHOB